MYDLLCRQDGEVLDWELEDEGEVVGRGAKT